MPLLKTSPLSSPGAQASRLLKLARGQNRVQNEAGNLLYQELLVLKLNSLGKAIITDKTRSPMKELLHSAARLLAR